MKGFITLLFIAIFSTIITAQPVRKVLVEKFTSAYCGNCPRATNQLLQLEASHPELIWVGHHSKWVAGDAMYLPVSDAYYDDFTNSAPKATINRVQFPGQSTVATGTGSWATNIPAQIANPASVYVNMDGKYNTTNREITLDVTTNFYSAPTAGDMRITAFLVESEVQVNNTTGYNQANYDNNNPSSPLYQLGNPITNYIHRNVTRAVISDVWGTTGVIPTTPALNTDYIQQYTYTVPTGFDITKCSLVAFVSYYDANQTQREVLNANNIDVASLEQILPVTSAYTFDDSNDPAITFADNSTNNPDAWQWDFGDGAMSTMQNPNHTYTQNGTYNVCLTASNDAGTNGQVCQNVMISQVILPPTSAFTFNAANAPTVTFTDNSTNAPTSWMWDFDDGSTSAMQNPTHTFTQNGTYNVCLTASNDAGTNGQVCQTVVVSQVIQPSTSAFTFDAVNAPTVTFTDNSTNAPTSWMWNFDDGNTSTMQNPTHMFAQNGTYNVCLTASNDAGSTGPICQDVVISFTSSNEEIRNAALLNVYPNPASELLVVELPADLIGKDIVIELYDVVGRMTLQNNLNTGETAELNVADLSPGIYLLKVLGSEGEMLGRSKVLVE